MDRVNRAQIENWFSYHPATSKTGPIHDDVRERFMDLALFLLRKLPSGADRTLAIRKLQEAMWASNAAVACEIEDNYAMAMTPERP